MGLVISSAHVADAHNKAERLTIYAALGAVPEIHRLGLRAGCLTRCRPPPKNLVQRIYAARRHEGVGHVGMYLLKMLNEAGAKVTVCDVNKAALDKAQANLEPQLYRLPRFTASNVMSTLPVRSVKP